VQIQSQFVSCIFNSYYAWNLNFLQKQKLFNSTQTLLLQCLAKFGAK
jgi:hypothetical protein